jgi:hypothetical protein
MSQEKYLSFRRDDAHTLGVSTEKTLQLWQVVRENNARLDRCPGPHHFVPLEARAKVPLATTQTFATDHRCSVCGGVLDLLAVRWYQRGLAHARDEGARFRGQQTT